MKIRIIDPVIGYDDKPLLNGDSSPVILRDLISVALNSQEPNETLAAEQKAKIFAVSVKLFLAPATDFSVEERALIKERAGKTMTPLAYGRIVEVMDREPRETVQES